MEIFFINQEKNFFDGLIKGKCFEIKLNSDIFYKIFR